MKTHDLRFDNVIIQYVRSVSFCCCLLRLNIFVVAVGYKLFQVVS
jgi:hypothetical protein